MKIKSVLFFAFTVLLVARTSAAGYDLGKINIRVKNNNAGNHNVVKLERYWQKVDRDQPLPRGVHVRINLQTGEREAKLWERDEPDVPEEHGEVVVSESGDPKQHLSAEELKNALKNIRNELPADVEKAGNVKKAFRDIDTIKREFSNLKLNLQSETETIQGLLKEYKNATIAGKIGILREMEYILHQYDVAVDFVKLDGISVIVPDLNSTDEEVRAGVAFTLGSAMQGNPHVQVEVIRSQGVLRHLLTLVALDASEAVRLRAFYAISCLIRHFPDAQRQLIDHGGFSVFAGLFDAILEHIPPARHKGDATGTQLVASRKLLSKVVTLIYDLISEQNLARIHSEEGNQQKMKQYERFDLVGTIHSNGFCQLVPQLLKESQDVSPDSDLVEKVLRAMSAMMPWCRDDFGSYEAVVRELRDSFRRRSIIDKAEDADDVYFEGLEKIAEEVMELLTSNSNNSPGEGTRLSGEL